ncbi:Uncharacterized protein PECH_003747 [Penicillium ucsense]|uniref:HNH nuclease domain-containing protein n=1 Tax=Penicillium ucsense TaxID=2839758 RepID=A0A8J8WGY7_9EURO|nr:Uncharacterized protein PECM_002225 [Penicillium ucsense]KAF7729191.1 Uncharacterized protein PECH_003747 [Penicillium ucsense]
MDSQRNPSLVVGDSQESLRGGDITALTVQRCSAEYSGDEDQGYATFDHFLWHKSAEIEELQLMRRSSDRHTPTASSNIPKEDWVQTPEAQETFEVTKATEAFERITAKQDDEQVESYLYPSFGKPSQIKFRKAVIDAYDSFTCTEGYWPQLWCQVLGEYIVHRDVIASYLFSWRYGQETMDAIFGEAAKSELFSPHNGILMSYKVKAAFDIGKLAIVPCDPKGAGWTIKGIRNWLSRGPDEYQVKILDQKWDRLDKEVGGHPPLTFRDLDGRKLQFRNSFRPAARYMYFHYCIQVVRYAWQHKEVNGPAEAAEMLRNEHGQSYWGTSGKYLPKNMLQSVIQEIGHEYKSLLDRACPSTGNSDLLLELAAVQVITLHVLDPRPLEETWLTLNRRVPTLENIIEFTTDSEDE